MIEALGWPVGSIMDLVVLLVLLAELYAGRVADALDRGETAMAAMVGIARRVDGVDHEHLQSELEVAQRDVSPFVDADLVTDGGPGHE